MVREMFFFLTITSFFLFVSMGNIFRILESSLFSGHLLLSEAVLYFFSLISLFFLKVPSKVLLYLGSFIALITLSFLYGAFFQGFDSHASLYACRLILLGISSYALSSVFYVRYEGDVALFFSFLFKTYVVALLLGFAIYFFFPESEKLWRILREYYVGFNGDPHVGRFVSVYFDPNYYATIAGMAFLIASYLYTLTKKLVYQVGSFLFFISGILTWSRSGMVVLFFLLAYRALPLLLKGKFTRRGFLSFVFVGLTSVLLGYFYIEDLGAFLYRTIYFFEEDSALCRLHTFQFGLSLLKDHLYFGIGTNYLYKYAQEGVHLNSLDSSLLSLLVQLGLIPFIALTAALFFRSLSFFKLKIAWEKSQEKVPHFFSWLVGYAFIVIFFASQFNNLLFYPFWALPFSVISLFILRGLSIRLSDKTCYILTDCNDCLGK